MKCEVISSAYILRFHGIIVFYSLFLKKLELFQAQNIVQRII